MKAIKIIRLVFGFLGALCIIAGILFGIHSQRFLEASLETKGRVVDLSQRRSSSDEGTSYTYAPVVEFTLPNGESILFTSSVSSNPPSYSRGDMVPVLYREDNPQSARIHSFGELWLGSIIFISIGTPFFLTGLLMFLIPALKKGKEARLRKEGIQIDGRIVRVYQNWQYSVNGQHPWLMEVEISLPYNNGKLLIKSPHLWENPQPILEQYGIDSLPVLVNRNNYKQHVVLVDKLRLKS